VKQLFILYKLPLKTHVGEDDRSSFASECEGLLEVHFSILHQKCDDTGSTSRYTSVAVHEDTSFRHTFLDESHGCWEVADQTTRGGVCDVDYLVAEVFGEERLDTRGHLEYVGNACRFKTVEVRGSLQITQVEPVLDFIHFITIFLTKQTFL